MRWVFLVPCVNEADYWVDYGAVSHIVITTYFLGMMITNDCVRWRIRSLDRMDLHWLFVLSVMDVATLTVATLTVSMMISGGFDRQ